MSSHSLRITIRSRKVPTRVVNFPLRHLAANGQCFTESRDLLVYDYVLDELQERALKEAANLASRLDLRLEVLDLTRDGPTKRIVRSIAYSSWNTARSLWSRKQGGKSASPSRRTIISTVSLRSKSGRWNNAK